jgi:hypothetical protein
VFWNWVLKRNMCTRDASSGRRLEVDAGRYCYNYRLNEVEMSGLTTCTGEKRHDWMRKCNLLKVLKCLIQWCAWDFISDRGMVSSLTPLFLEWLAFSEVSKSISRDVFTKKLTNGTPHFINRTLIQRSIMLMTSVLMFYHRFPFVAEFCLKTFMLPLIFHTDIFNFGPVHTALIVPEAASEYRHSRDNGCTVCSIYSPCRFSI